MHGGLSGAKRVRPHPFNVMASASDFIGSIGSPFNFPCSSCIYDAPLVIKLVILAVSHLLPSAVVF